ncbi:hypothetical protein AcW1_004612 [Taiwanofungus camphoratus]|nr:hypothetical protein AcW2_006385 [Antrodia cinnamomea]KAI0959941.1 hypothetical protein AcW1_004612 [Antrodia cinnamomea]
MFSLPLIRLHLSPVYEVQDCSWRMTLTLCGGQLPLSSFFPHVSQSRKPEKSNRASSGKRKIERVEEPVNGLAKKRGKHKENKVSPSNVVVNTKPNLRAFQPGVECQYHGETAPIPRAPPDTNIQVQLHTLRKTPLECLTTPNREFDDLNDCIPAEEGHADSGSSFRAVNVPNTGASFLNSTPINKTAFCLHVLPTPPPTSMHWSEKFGLPSGLPLSPVCRTSCSTPATNSVKDIRQSPTPGTPVRRSHNPAMTSRRHERTPLRSSSPIEPDPLLEPSSGPPPWLPTSKGTSVRLVENAADHRSLRANIEANISSSQPPLFFVQRLIVPSPKGHFLPDVSPHSSAKPADCEEVYTLPAPPIHSQGEDDVVPSSQSQERVFFDHPASAPSSTSVPLPPFEIPGSCGLSGGEIIASSQSQERDMIDPRTPSCPRLRELSPGEVVPTSQFSEQEMVMNGSCDRPFRHPSVVCHSGGAARSISNDAEENDKTIPQPAEVIQSSQTQVQKDLTVSLVTSTTRNALRPAPVIATSNAMEECFGTAQEGLSSLCKSKESLDRYDGSNDAVDVSQPSFLGEETQYSDQFDSQLCTSPLRAPSSYASSLADRFSQTPMTPTQLRTFRHMFDDEPTWLQDDGEPNIQSPCRFTFEPVSPTLAENSVDTDAVNRRQEQADGYPAALGQSGIAIPEIEARRQGASATDPPSSPMASRHVEPLWSWNKRNELWADDPPNLPEHGAESMSTDPMSCITSQSSLPPLVMDFLDTMHSEAEFPACS